MRALIPVIFFLSGACGLVYQVVWARMLTVVFGATIVAVSTTLAAFMAGLALGSFLLGRRVHRVQRPLLLFALLEAGVGIYAFLFPQLIKGIALAATALQPLAASDAVPFPILRFLLSFALLLIPTSLMGATLPAMSRYVVRRFAHVGGGVAWLYAVNTFGAVAGVALTTFLLMEWLGLKGSTYAVGATNLLVACLAWFVSSRSQSPQPTSETATAAEEDGDGEGELIPSGLMKLVIIGFALSGFAALGYEVAWLRLLLVAFAINTHYEFSIILIAFLLGIAIGSFICSRVLDSKRDLLTLFGMMEVLIGVMGIGSVLLFVSMAELVGFVRSSSEWWHHRVGLFAIAFVIMLVPTLLMGALLPLVGRMNTKRLSLLGRGIGDIYAVNSLGAIGGAFATGFILIPAIGTVGTFQALGALNLIIGAAVLLLHPGSSITGRLKITAAIVAVVTSLMLLTPADLLRRLSEPASSDSELLFFSEGREGVVTVSGRRGDDYRNMRFNGGGQVPTDYGAFQLFRLLGHLPLLLHEDPQDVLVIALGGGIALGSVAQHELESVVCVEMVPDIIEGARQEFGPFNHDVLETLEGSSHISLVVDDGRNYLLSSPRRYDVITGDATHPTSTDSWVLYTADFYELCKSRLTEAGIFVQWLPFHGLHVDDYKTVLRTFQQVFEHASLWRTNNFAIMVGTVGQLSLDVAAIDERLRRERVSESLAAADLGSTLDVLSCFFMDETSLDAYVGEGAVNTDDHPHLSFAGKRGFRARTSKVIGDMGEHLKDHPTNITPYIVRDGRTPEGIDRQLFTYMAAKKLVLRGDWFRMQRAWDKATQAYSRALQINSREHTARHFYDVVRER